MKHYLMTASHRSPDYPLDANRRRIELCRRVTARSLADQDGEWTWLVYVHPEDPLLDERLDAFRSAGHPVVAMPTGVDPLDVIDWSGDVLTTRIDDDDAFARGAFRRLYRAAGQAVRRTVFMLPVGYRVNEGRSIFIAHAPHNAWSSLYAPRGDRAHIRLEQHHHVDRLAPVLMVDHKPAFLWVRHQDTATPFRSTREPLTDEVRGLYDVDWGLIDGSVAA
jgi:hypothetical protein